MEYQEIYKGYHIVVMFVNTHRCGYVGLPKGNKYVGYDYDDIDVDVHGGLTFAENSHNVDFALNDFPYYIGFDCAHSGDAEDLETMKKYGDITKERIGWSFGNGTPKSKDYVLKELYKLVNQLKES